MDNWNKLNIWKNCVYNYRSKYFTYYDSNVILSFLDFFLLRNLQFVWTVFKSLANTGLIMTVMVDEGNLFSGSPENELMVLGWASPLCTETPEYLQVYRSEHLILWIHQVVSMNVVLLGIVHLSWSILHQGEYADWSQVAYEKDTSCLMLYVILHLHFVWFMINC